MLGVAGEAAYHRGDHATAERFARAGLARAADPVWQCLVPLTVTALARGAHAEVVGYARAAAAAGPRASEGLGLAALATAYAGDLDGARGLLAEGAALAASPTARSWCAYVAGEIDAAAGRLDPAERHYRDAVTLARRSGATFLAGVATVGLLAVLARSGRVADALRGYRDVTAYFARTGNRTHQWTALRNLADLLRRLGDPAAAVLDAAADGAPDAPAVVGGRPAPTGGAPDRAAGRAVAREAVERQLTRVPRPR